MSNYIIYHHPICPFSRKVRILLSEKDISFILEEIKVWERKADFIKLNPANEIPVIKNTRTGEYICDSAVICEYLEELHTENNDLLKGGFLGSNPIDRAETRRLQAWFDRKFYNEVTKYVVEEKIYNRFLHRRHIPNTQKLKAAQYNLDTHMKYVDYLLQSRKWLAGENFSLADISAAAQFSSLDYLGDIPWKKLKRVKEWYATIKSKKGFQPLLKDKLEGFRPPAWYSDLDF